MNLSELGLADECFSSTLAETRSSTSTTATLKDFVLGSFDTCEAGMTTEASRSGTITPGQSVTDTATVTGSGTDDPPVPTGTVQFFLCGPAQVTAAGCPPGAGTQIGTPPEGEPLVAGANSSATAISEAVNTSASTAPGKYCFRAVYSGDDNYDPDEHTNASTAAPQNECFMVQDTSAITTAQKWLPNDTAHVTLASGGTPTGTVTFELFENGTCAAPVARTFADQPIDGSGNAETNNSTYETTAKTISWKATFNPTGGPSGSTAPCETMNVTLDNDITSP